MSSLPALVSIHMEKQTRPQSKQIQEVWWKDSDKIMPNIQCQFNNI